jgi:hypothetical protein
MTAQGVGSRLDTYIDIPLEIGLPHFISDESSDDFGSNFTNFKLSLQSVICHRGNSLDSGHYIALVRGDASNAIIPVEEPQPSQPGPPPAQTKPPPSPLQQPQRPPSEPQIQPQAVEQSTTQIPEPEQNSVLTKQPAQGQSTTEPLHSNPNATVDSAQPDSEPEAEDKPPAHDDHSQNRMPSGPWVLFDDLAKERVISVDIRQALRQECPYLLFYQVVPIDEGLVHGDPPSYESIINGDADRLENGGSNRQYATDSESASNAPSGGPPSISDPSTVSFSTVTESDYRGAIASNTSTSTDATNVTLKPLPDPASTLHKSQSVNIASLKHDSDFSVSGTELVDHASLLSEGLTMRPHSIDLSTLAARSATASAMAAVSSLEPPQERNSMSSVERNSINFSDVDQRSSIYTASAKGGSSAPITPGDEHEGKGGFLGISRSRRASANPSSAKSWRKSRSRPPSQSGEGRLSLNLSSMGMGALTMGRLKAAVSKDKLTQADSTEKNDDSGHSDDAVHNGSHDKHKHGSVRRGKSLRHGKKPKSRSASVARFEAGKEEAERPDRECAVM